VRSIAAACSRCIPKSISCGVVTLDQELRAGDRVEILRPLGADPKTARRRRAEKSRR
jgi:putative ubiquitin-RnfH superfamily antitoxin RatB of RatAB toxin-antitoxin module